jgi:hypothetical protein
MILLLAQMFFPLKSGRYILYSFQKLTQFSKVNNVKVTAASNIDDVLPRETRVFLIQVYQPILNQANVFVG